MAKYQAYAEYKDSGVEWLGKIPSHWLATQVKYGYLVTLGKMLQSTPKSSLDELKLYLKAQNIQPNGINIDQVESMWFSPDECKKLLLQKSDVLVSEGGDAGRSAIWNCELEECYIQNAINRVRPKFVNNSKYFLYWMKFLKSTDFINIICNKATIAHYTAEKLEGSPIFLPSSDEQKNIANFLDHETTKIDHLIEKQQQLIELLKEKRQAVISHAVTKGLNPNVPMKDSGVEWLGEVPEHWNVTCLARISGIKRGSGYQNIEMEVEGQDTIQMLRIADMHEIAPALIVKNTEVIRYLVEEGDILVAGTGATAGISMLVPKECNGWVHSYNSIKVKVDSKKVNSAFLQLFLISDYIKKSLDVSFVGSAQPFVDTNGLGRLRVLLPPLHEQINIYDYLNIQTRKIDLLISKAESAIQLMQERRTALISAAVTGKIDVRHWQSPTVAEADTELST